ncbi:MAG: Aminodeoxychorismate lyase [Alphaproteobacteria bacterium]|nr:MAG: Aminodeoxychorismate lyase [Alphaproteobacteria bacterium]
MIWLNGDIVSAEAAISANDRGLLLGESVFETLLVKNQVPQFWTAHLARLAASCTALGLACSYDDAVLRDGVMALFAADNALHGEKMRAVLRLTVSGGAGGRGLVPTAQATPMVMMQLSDAPPRPDALRLHMSDILRFAGQFSATHKTGQYVDNIMARRQALAAQADEAVMANQHGRLACAAAGNIFVRFDDRLLTPPLGEGALPGVIRGALLEKAQIDGLQIEEAAIDMARLEKADALYVTNSVNGVVAAAFGQADMAQKKQGLVLNDALPEFSCF